MAKAWAAFWTFALLALVVGGIAFVWVAVTGPQRTAVKAEKAAGVAAVAAGQAQTEQRAQQIVVAGQARDHVDLTIHQDNAHAILAAPGADTPVDPDLVRVWRIGLCKHAAYATDPQCAGLLQGDSAGVAKRPDPAAAAAGPD